jgi:hypothetical protein
MRHDKTRSGLLLLAGLLLGIGLSALWQMQTIIPAAEGKDAPLKKPVDLASLAAELENIKGRLPDQSHAMADVGYQFGNLWFAGQKQNWPLAEFYWKETRSHLAWAVRIIPKRKDNAGREIDLVAILQSLENSPLKQLGEAIATKDSVAFDKAYRFMLEGCYACHKAADKPYIRPQVPAHPEANIVNFDPKADWPR